MENTISNAIRECLVLELTYNGLKREVEPHAFGLGTSGNVILRCYQVTGGHSDPSAHRGPWETLKLEKISALAVTDRKFPGPRPGYKRGDKGMSEIYAEL